MSVITCLVTTVKMFKPVPQLMYNCPNMVPGASRENYDVSKISDLARVGFDAGVAVKKEALKMKAGKSCLEVLFLNSLWEKKVELWSRKGSFTWST